jgi:hypothetical protein
VTCVYVVYLAAEAIGSGQLPLGMVIGLFLSPNERDLFFVSNGGVV